MPEARIGAIVIGRNEADRLAAALRSVKAAGLSTVYVDSASSDASVAIANGLADRVIELDPAIPLSAARARNEGLAALAVQWPTLKHVLFLDGDCVLIEGFVPAAAAVMDARSELAVVVGQLVERPAPGNIFSRLAALEWWSATGDINNFGNLGGIMLARIADFQRVGGFNPRIIAGEDSEFGVRLALAGRVVTKIAHPMAEHDACIDTFGQWWTRSVRAGHALTERYMLHGRSKVQDCKRDFWSTLFWGLAVPAVAILPAWWTYGASLLLLGGYPVLCWRMYRWARRQGASSADALLSARFGLYSKAANMIGLVRYFRRRLTGQVRIIEYKRPTLKETAT